MNPYNSGNKTSVSLLLSLEKKCIDGANSLIRSTSASYSTYYRQQQEYQRLRGDCQIPLQNFLDSHNMNLYDLGYSNDDMIYRSDISQ